MERQLAELERTVKEWQDMVRVCEEEDRLLLDALGDLAKVLGASTPPWLAARCFEQKLHGCEA